MSIETRWSLEASWKLRKRCPDAARDSPEACAEAVQKRRKIVCSRNVYPDVISELLCRITRSKYVELIQNLMPVEGDMPTSTVHLHLTSVTENVLNQTTYGNKAATGRKQVATNLSRIHFACKTSQSASSSG